MFDPTRNRRLLPDGYRYLSEASDQLRTQIIISGVSDRAEWVAKSLDHIHVLLIEASIFACVELPDQNIRRISPTSWRISIDFDHVIASGLSPSDRRWPDIDGMPLIVSDADFERILQLSKKLPSEQRIKPPTIRKSSGEGIIIKLGAEIWRENPSLKKGAVLNQLLAAGLKVTANQWNRGLFREAREASGHAPLKAGAPKKESRGS